MLQRSIGLVIALLLGLALAASPGQAGNHSLDILNPTTSYNREVGQLLRWVLGFAAVVFVVVTGAMVYVTLKFRRTGRETREPVQFHGNDRLEVLWTIIPTLIVFIIFGLTAQSMFKLDRLPAGAMTVEVKGWRYWWDYNYPEQGVRNSSELVVPVGKPLVLKVTGGDVIHSYRITSLVGTQDAIPGITNRIIVTPEKVGDYYGQCVELCGASHANMRFRVKVVPQEEFDRFITGAKAYKAAPPADPNLARGETLFKANCAGCHHIAGVSPQNLRYPDLTFFGNRTTVGSGMWPNTPQYLEPWIKNSPGMKPGSQMPAFPQLSDADVKALGTYLLSHKVAGVDFNFPEDQRY
ncbi:MAG: cytochrome c oxidase subunit II [Meiothermus sp.]